MSMIIPTLHPAAWDEFNEIIRYLAREAGADIALAFEGCVFCRLDFRDRINPAGHTF